MSQDRPLDGAAPRRRGSGLVVRRAEQFGLIVVWLLLIAVFVNDYSRKLSLRERR